MNKTYNIVTADTKKWTGMHQGVKRGKNLTVPKREKQKDK